MKVTILSIIGAFLLFCLIFTFVNFFDRGELKSVTGTYISKYKTTYSLKVDNKIQSFTDYGETMLNFRYGDKVTIKYYFKEPLTLFEDFVLGMGILSLIILGSCFILYLISLIN